MILEVFFTKSALPNGQTDAERFIEDASGRLGQDLSGGSFYDMGSTLQWKRTVSAGYNAEAFAGMLAQVSRLRAFNTDYDGMSSINVRPQP